MSPPALSRLELELVAVPRHTTARLLALNLLSGLRPTTSPVPALFASTITTSPQTSGTARVKMPGAGKQPEEIQRQIRELLEAGFDPTTIHRRLKVGRSSIYRMKRCLQRHGTVGEMRPLKGEMCANVDRVDI